MTKYNDVEAEFYRLLKGESAPAQKQEQQTAQAPDPIEEEFRRRLNGGGVDSFGQMQQAAPVDPFGQAQLSTPTDDFGQMQQTAPAAQPPSNPLADASMGGKAKSAFRNIEQGYTDPTAVARNTFDTLTSEDPLEKARDAMEKNTYENRVFKAIGGSAMSSLAGLKNTKTQVFEETPARLAAGITTPAVTAAGLVKDAVDPSGKKGKDSARFLLEGFGASHEMLNRLMPEVQKHYEEIDKLDARGKARVEEAKDGLGFMGRLGIDMASTGSEMLFDRLVGNIIPGGGMASMALRVYGRGAMEARQQGEDAANAMLHGLGQAGIEYFTEKMFGLGLRGEKGAIRSVENLIHDGIEKFAAKGGSRLLGYMLAGFGGESVEEMVSDALNYGYDWLLRKFTGGFQWTDKPFDWAGMLYDGLLGGLMGIGGGAVEGVSANRAATMKAFSEGERNAIDMHIGLTLAEKLAETNNEDAVEMILKDEEARRVFEKATGVKLEGDEGQQIQTIQQFAEELRSEGKGETERSAPEAPQEAAGEEMAPGGIPALEDAVKDATAKPALLNSEETQTAPEAEQPKQRPKVKVRPHLEAEAETTISGPAPSQQNIDSTAPAAYTESDERSVANDQGRSAEEAGRGVAPGEGSLGVPAEPGRGPDRSPGSAGIVRVNPELQSAYRKSGVVEYGLTDSSGDSTAYSRALEDGRNSDTEHGWMVTPQTAEDLQGKRLLLAPDGSEGVVITKDGDIEGVFKNKSNGKPGALMRLLPQAVAVGGTKLDCYGAGLARNYARFGFIPVARVEFNEKYANPGWDPSKGRPDVFIMMHDGSSPAQMVQNKNAGNYHKWTNEELDALPRYDKNGYDDAVAYRDSLMEQRKTADQQASDELYRELGEQYGTIEKGENAARESAVPRQTGVREKVGEAVRSMYEAEATREDRLEDMRNALVDEKFSFEPVSDERLAKDAERTIRKKGWEAALRDWTADVRSGKADENLVAMGATLYNNAANSDMSGRELVDLMVDYNMLCHRLGRGLEAARILKRLSPSGRLYALQRTVDRINEERKTTKKDSKKLEEAEQALEALEKAKESALESTEETLKDPTSEAAKQVAEAIKRDIDRSRAESKAKEKTNEQRMAEIALRLARERLNAGKKTAKTNTATDLLREAAGNESLLREIYELAQAEFHKEESADYQEDAEAFTNAPPGLDRAKGSTDNRLFARAIAESAARTGENARYIREQSALGVSDSDIAYAIAEDLIAETGASEDLASSIRLGCMNYVHEVLQGDSKAAGDRVSSLVSQQMRAIGQKFRELATQSGATKESVRQDLADMIAMDYALDPASAKRVSESVASEYERQLHDAVKKELERRYAPKKNGDKKAQDMQAKLEEALNLGAFDSEYAREATKKVFGVDNDIKLDPKLAEEFLKAKTNAERDEIISRMQQNIADQIPATVMEKWNALRYLNMLGNFKTQFRNLAGNATMMTMAAVKNHLVRGTLEGLYGAVNSKYEKTSSLAYDPRLFGEAFRDWFQVKDEAMGERKYSDAGRQFEKGIQDKRRIFKFAPLEGYRKATNWAMEAGDQIFSVMTYADAMAGWMQAHKVKHVSDMTPEMLERARKHAIQEAQEATFRDSNGVSKWAAKVGRGNQDTKFGKLMGVVSEGILPFRKTPANVLVRMWEYSPLGLLTTIGQKVTGATNTQQTINNLSKSFTGSGLAVVGYLLAAAGKLRTPDDDDKLEAYRKQKGQQDYSWITDDNKSVSLDWLSPSSAPLFMGATAQKIFSEGGLTGDQALKLLGQASDQLIEMSMLSGLNDALEMATSYNNDQAALPALMLNSLLSYLTQGWSNSLIRQAEQASESTRRTSFTEADSILAGPVQRKLSQYFAGIPGYDYQQQDYIDGWGRKEENGDALERTLQAFLNPANVKQDRSTPYDEELERLHKEGYNNVLALPPARSTKVNDERLSPEEYEKYATVVGQKKLELIGDFLDSDEYKKLDDKERSEVIENLYSYANYQGRKAVMESRGDPYEDKAMAKLDSVSKAGVDIPGYLIGKQNAEKDGKDGLANREVFDWLYSSGYNSAQRQAIWEANKGGSNKSWQEYQKTAPAAILASYGMKQDKAERIATAINGGKSDWASVKDLSQEELWNYYLKHPGDEKYIKALWNAKGNNTSWADYKARHS